MIDVAYAVTPAAAEAGNTDFAMSLLPMVLIFGVFYLLLIRPQQKKAKDHKQMLDHLRKGDSVITQGGIYGKITALADSSVTLEVADKVRIKVSRAHIQALAINTGGSDS